jgi:hypothetical protein
MITYLRSNRTAGYSGFVLYYAVEGAQAQSIWMVPGTWEDDWDNRS